MTIKHKINGFPQIGEKEIELLDAAEILLMPFFDFTSLDDVYKRGGSFYRNLIDLSPLTNKKKYCMLSAKLQFLKPGSMSIRYLNSWHIDSHSEIYDTSKESDTIHLLLSKCTALTEFNITELEIELKENDNIFAANAQLAVHPALVGKRIESNKFVTFNNSNAHRAMAPMKPEFRFMFRIIESDYLVPRNYEDGFRLYSKIYTNENGKMVEKENINRFENGITIKF